MRSGMNKPWMVALIPLIIIIGVLVFSATTMISSQIQGAPQKSQAGIVVIPTASGDFEKATGPRNFIFPLDHGPHPNFQTEWWYYTGNLDSPSGQHFGYELTF